MSEDISQILQPFPDHLCPACERVIQSLDDIAADDEGRVHYHNYEDCVDSARRGCYICLPLALAQENLNNSGPVPVSSWVVVSKPNLEWDRELYYSIKLHHYPSARIAGVQEDLSANFEFKRYHAIGIDKVPAGSTTDKDSITTAKSWLQICQSTHEACNEAFKRDTPWYPSRLITFAESSSGIAVRLRECKDEPPQGSYVSLSHRWGGASFATLTTTNIDAMKAGIPFSHLSRTFQDAIEVTLQLGCQHLWIDSLCIIQDSEEDWLREASQMKNVYRNSLVTISATSPRALREGLQSVRNTSHVSALSRDIQSEQGTGTVKVAILYKELWDTLVDDAPLNRRGWILQESLLSRRILHFAPTQLAWECDKLRACETYPAGDVPTQSRHNAKSRKTLARYIRKGAAWRQQHPSNLDPGLHLERWRARFLMDPLERFFKQQEPPSHNWQNIVELYSRCSLTNPSDKLIGIASYFREFQHDDYIAGLWKKSFIEQLVWFRQGEVADPKPKGYHAPSWSWAAFHGPVEFRGPIWRFASWECRCQSVAKLVKSEVVLVNHNDRTGAVRYASATVTGRKIVLGSISTLPGFNLTTSIKVRSGERCEYETLKECDINITLDTVLDDRQDLSVHLLILHTLEQKEDPWKMAFHTYTLMVVEGLAIHQIGQPNSGDQRFRRLGYFKAKGRGTKELLRHSTKETITLI